MMSRGYMAKGACNASPPVTVPLGLEGETDQRVHC